MLKNSVGMTGSGRMWHVWALAALHRRVCSMVVAMVWEWRVSWVVTVMGEGGIGWWVVVVVVAWEWLLQRLRPWPWGTRPVVWPVPMVWCPSGRHGPRVVGPVLAMLWRLGILC